MCCTDIHAGKTLIYIKQTNNIELHDEQEDRNIKTLTKTQPKPSEWWCSPLTPALWKQRQADL